MAKTQSSAHAVYRISYHFVWAPKDRKKALKGEIAERIAELLEWTAKKYEFEIETVSVQIDHVHVLVSAPPCYSPADLARMMKSITAKKIFEEYPGRKRKEFWGGRLWERGYYVGTSGEAVSSDLIRRYIEYCQNQQQLRLLD